VIAFQLPDNCDGTVNVRFEDQQAWNVDPTDRIVAKHALQVLPINPSFNASLFKRGLEQGRMDCILGTKDLDQSLFVHAVILPARR
jgi:hypothetical protein